MTFSSPQDFAKHLARVAEKLSDGKILEISAVTSMRETQERIFEDGLNSQGNKIGSYSTKPVYIDPDNSPKKFTTEGKTGRKEFTSGKKKGRQHKTRYFAGGYKQYKQTIGRESGFVNLQNFGRLRQDMAAGLQRVDANTIIYGPKADREKKKLLGLQKRFGPIMPATEKEREIFTKTFRFEVNKVLNA